MSLWRDEAERLIKEIEKAYDDAGGYPSMAHEYANFLFGCQQNGIDIFRDSNGDIHVVYNPERKNIVTLAYEYEKHTHTKENG